MQKTSRVFCALAAGVCLLLALLFCFPALGEGEYRLLTVGGYGDDVLLLKQRLQELGYFKSTALNNRFTEDTAQRVSAFQAACGLAQTGEASPALQALLYSDTALAPQAPVTLPDGLGEGAYRTLKEGCEGDDVLALRKALHAMGLVQNNDKSAFDAAMAKAVTTLQAARGLAQTGEADTALQHALFSGAFATAAPSAAPSPTPKPTSTPTGPKEPVALPALNEKGFLADAAAEPFVYADREDGQWHYISASVHITIKRMTNTHQNITWFEADILCAPEAPLTAMLALGGSEAGFNFMSPVKVASQYNALFAISDDFYGGRRLNHKTQGVIVRAGEIKADETYPADSTNKWPSLDVLALFGDGSMRAFASDAHTAQEYLDMGVTDTWAFGPVLLSGGAVNQALYDEGILRYTDREPRMAIGCVTPYHYVALCAKGRTDDSKGVRLSWLAERMQYLGCAEALNLDGGNTSAMYFMGDVINKAVRSTALREISSMIGLSLGE